MQQSGGGNIASHAAQSQKRQFPDGLPQSRWLTTIWLKYISIKVGLTAAFPQHFKPFRLAVCSAAKVRLKFLLNFAPERRNLIKKISGTMNHSSMCWKRIFCSVEQVHLCHHSELHQSSALWHHLGRLKSTWKFNYSHHKWRLLHKLYSDRTYSA